MRDDAAATQFSIDTAHSIWNTRKLLIKLRSGELKKYTSEKHIYSFAETKVIYAPHPNAPRFTYKDY